MNFPGVLSKDFNERHKYIQGMKINELFYSIQGEGTYAGLPTIFLRTTGCNLRCSYCDTTYAYTQGTEMSIKEILIEIEKYPSKHLCITGGEPLLQKDIPTLLKHLFQKKFTICIETNGSINVKKYTEKRSVIISLDIKCPSSGMQRRMILNNISFLSQTDQLKFIIKNKQDYVYAKKILHKYQPRCTVFFQPVWGTNPKKLASWILRDGLPVRLGLQLQKIIWGTKRGV
jgi:7-carboxy-7-deazaguanine synthase